MIFNFSWRKCYVPLIVVEGQTCRPVGFIWVVVRKNQKEPPPVHQCLFFGRLSGFRLLAMTHAMFDKQIQVWMVARVEFRVKLRVAITLSLIFAGNREKK